MSVSEMTHSQFDLTYFSPKLEKRPSCIEGRGLFAREGIAAGEVVVVKGGYILTKDQRDRVGQELGPSEIQVTDDLFIGPTTSDEREGGMMHLNHSCEPNLGVQGQIVYVALRDIAVDEEITFDYATNSDEPEEMNCWRANLPRQSDRRRLAQAGASAEIRRILFLVHPAPN
jgi:uncharacterized protein